MRNRSAVHRLRARLHPLAAAVSLLLATGPTPAGVVDWIGPDASFWDLVTNWSPGFPGASSDVHMGAFNTELRSGAFSLQSLTGSGQLTLSGGSLSLAAASSLGGLVFSNSELSGAGALTVTGASNWLNGRMSGVGGTRFEGPLDLGGNSYRDISQRTIVFAGTTTWTNAAGGNGGRLRTGSGATLSNTGTFQDQLDVTSPQGAITNELGGSASSFVNSGTYAKTGAATTEIGIAFNNTAAGKVTVSAGRLLLDGGGTSSGTFDVASGATLELGGGTHSLSGLQAGGGTGRLLVSVGSVNATGANSFGGQLTLTGGTFSVGDGGSFNAVAFDQSAGTVTGAGTLNISGAASWAGGTMNGTGSTVFAGPLALAGNGYRDVSQRNVVFAGTTTWTNAAGGNGGRLRTGSGATLSNTGTFQDQLDVTSPQGAITNELGGSASSFVNSGTYAKTGAATTEIGIAFNNTAAGKVTVSAGRLLLDGGGTSSGTFDVASGATLELGGGTHSLSGLQAGGGTGRLLVSVGSVNATGANSFGGQLTLTGGTFSVGDGGSFNAVAFEQSAGTVAGAGTLNISGAANWTIGTMTGTGSTVFAGPLALAGNGYRDITQRNVVFAGTTTWTNGAGGNTGRFRTGSGATLINTGTFQDQLAFYSTIDNELGGSASSLSNSGTYVKTGAVTTQINIAFNNAATGTVNVSAGRLLLSGGGTSGGAFNAAAGASVELGGGTHTLSGLQGGSGRLLLSAGNAVASGVNSFAGQLAVSGGTFSAVDDFATVGFDQAGGTVAGANTLSVSGAASWSGGAMAGSGQTRFDGSLALTGNGLRDVSQRNVVFAGTTTWTNTGGGYGGYFRTGSGATLSNTGTFLDQLDFASSVSNDLGGSASSFVNSGTYTKTGTGATTFYVPFNNSGLVNGTGVLVLTADSNHSGVFAMDAGGTVALIGGTHTFSGDSSAGGAGRVLLGNGSSSATATVGAGSMSTTGRWDLQSGFVQGGGGTMALNGTTNWTGTRFQGAGTTSFGGQLFVTGNGYHGVTGHTLAFAGTTTWTNTSGGYSGEIITGSGATLSNTGTFHDQLSADSSISNDFGGAPSSFSNSGLYVKSGAVTSFINIAFTNTGTTRVSVGALSLNGGLVNFSAGTLSGGTYEVFGNSGLGFAGANVVTNAATVLLDGSGSALYNSNNFSNALANFATNTAAGSFTIQNGRNFTSAGAFTNAGLVSVGSGSTFTASGSFSDQAGGTLQLTGGSFNATSLANAGTVQGFGTLLPTVQNTGLVRASGGTLAASQGVQGNSGNITIAAGATLDLGASANASSAFVLADAGSLDLGARNIVVFKDYTNAGFGSGNSFAARAGVSGTGLISGNNAAQALIGQVTAAGANAYVLDFGNLRGGTAATRSFQIANIGTGADIRGALQNGAPGVGNISDNRLSGSGVTPATFGPIAAGANGGNLGVTLTAGPVGGALNGQSVGVISNFGNVAAQTLNITGFTTVLAQGQAAPGGPIDLGNFRVGILPAASGSLGVSNTTTGPGAEQLGIASAVTTGNFAASNQLGSGFVAPGASFADAVGVATAGGVAGVNSGSVAVQFTTNGQVYDPGFTTQAANVQTVGLLARGYVVAQPALPAAPVNVGNFRLTTGASSSFAVTNTSAAPAGFQELLNATPGTADAGVTLAGAVTGLAPGATSHALVVGFAAGGAAGPRNGAAAVNLASDGAGSSNLGLYALGSATVNVVGTAYNVAAGAATPAPVVVPNQRLDGVGGAASVTLSVANTAPAGLYSEALNAGVLGVTGNAVSNNGSFANLAAGTSNSSAITVSVDNSVAGTRSGSLTLVYETDGSGSNGHSGLAAAAAGTQTLNVSGDVYRLASASAVTPGPVVFANQRVGGTLTQALTFTNTAAADGFSERLNASIAAGGTATAGGSFSLLAAGASSSALFVGVDTATAGAKSGTASIALASDGTGTSGFSPLALAGQSVNVSGNVFRLAQAGTVTPNTLNLGNVREGGALTQSLTLANLAAADGFSERLNASITATPGLVAGGSFSGLAAGSSSHSLFVGVDTALAGTRSGSATITLASDGTGSSGFAPLDLGTQVVNVTASVYRLASASQASPNPVQLADQRVGGTLTQALSLSNTSAADGFSEALSATIVASGSAMAGGSFSLLAAGASSTALRVGVDTSTAGAKTGTALISLASDGAGTSGLAALGLAPQSVNVSGKVFRLAVPVVDTTPLLLVGRVGDATLQAGIAVTNNAPDAFTERLNASIASRPAGTGAGTALTGLAPNAGGSLQLSLPTTTAGTFSGPVGVALVSSSAGTTSGAPDFSLGSVDVGLTGRVYAPAVAQVVNTAINFGIVRVGDVVAARTITLSNGATGALTDTLHATLGGAGTPFTAGGTVAGLAAGSSDSTSLQVQLATTTAGVFAGNATLGFSSQNPDLADLTLAPVGIALQAQVNNIAQAVLAKAGGAGSFSAASAGSAASWTLDFGTVLSGRKPATASLSLSNAASGTADALAGSFDAGAVQPGDPFVLSGFGSFSALAAGASIQGLTVSFTSGTVGSFDRVVVLNPVSTNGSGPDLALAGMQLHLVGTVVAVPEPGTWCLMVGGLLLLATRTRRLRRR
jgi:hypothetical protein